MLKTTAVPDRGGASSSSSSATSTDNNIDYSLLRPPIQTIVTGFLEARKAFDNGTEELQNLLSNECDIVYECKVCRNMFRSLMNFMNHKRVFCHNKFTPNKHCHFYKDEYVFDNTTIPITKFDVDEDVQKKNDSGIKRKRDLVSLIERLKRKQDDDTSLNDLYADALGYNKNNNNNDNNSNSNDNRNTNNSEQSNNVNNETMKKLNVKQKYMQLDKIKSIDGNNNSNPITTAVYQTVKYTDTDECNDNIEDEIIEINNCLNNKYPILGPDGKIIEMDNFDGKKSIFSDGKDLQINKKYSCKICKRKFETVKSLKFHIKIKHIRETYVYPCTLCQSTFLNPSGIINHLSKDHKKSIKRIRSNREAIYKRRVRRDEIPIKSQSRELLRLQRDMAREEAASKSHFDNIDRQNGQYNASTCIHCFKQFERRAVLATHMKACTAKNTTKNNSNNNNNTNNNRNNANGNEKINKNIDFNSNNSRGSGSGGSGSFGDDIDKADTESLLTGFEIKDVDNSSKSSTALNQFFNMINKNITSNDKLTNGDGTDLINRDIIMPTTTNGSGSGINGTGGGDGNGNAITTNTINTTKVNKRKRKLVSKIMLDDDVIYDDDDEIVNIVHGGGAASSSSSASSSVNILTNGNSLGDKIVNNLDNINLLNNKIISDKVEETNCDLSAIEETSNEGNDKDASNNDNTNLLIVNNMIISNENSNDGTSININQNLGSFNHNDNQNIINNNNNNNSNNNNSNIIENQLNHIIKPNIVINKKHYDRPYDEKSFCQPCKRQFTNVSNLRRHTAMLHHRQKKFVCQLCDEFKAFRRIDVTNHLRTVHKLTGESSELAAHVITLNIKKRKISTAAVSLVPPLLKLVGDSAVTGHIDNKSNKLETISIRGLSNEVTISFENNPIQSSPNAVLSSSDVSSKLFQSTSNTKAIKLSHNNDVNELNSFISSLSLSSASSSSSSDSNSAPSSSSSSSSSSPVHSPIPSPFNPIEHSISAFIEDHTKKSAKGTLPVPAAIMSNENVNTKSSINEPTISKLRPVRNRVKPINKDFVYDLSSLITNRTSYTKEQTFVPIAIKTRKRRSTIQPSSSASVSVSNQSEVLNGIQPISKLPTISSIKSSSTASSSSSITTTTAITSSTAITPTTTAITTTLSQTLSPTISTTRSSLKYLKNTDLNSSTTENKNKKSNNVGIQQTIVSSRQGGEKYHDFLEIKGSAYAMALNCVKQHRACFNNQLVEIERKICPSTPPPQTSSNSNSIKTSPMLLSPPTSSSSSSTTVKSPLKRSPSTYHYKTAQFLKKLKKSPFKRSYNFNKLKKVKKIQSPKKSNNNNNNNKKEQKINQFNQIDDAVGDGGNTFNEIIIKTEEITRQSLSLSSSSVAAGGEESLIFENENLIITTTENEINSNSLINQNGNVIENLNEFIQNGQYYNGNLEFILNTNDGENLILTDGIALPITHHNIVEYQSAETPSSPSSINENHYAIHHQQQQNFEGNINHNGDGDGDDDIEINEMNCDSLLQNGNDQQIYINCATESEFQEYLIANNVIDTVDASNLIGIDSNLSFLVPLPKQEQFTNDDDDDDEYTNNDVVDDVDDDTKTSNGTLTMITSDDGISSLTSCYPSTSSSSSSSGLENTNVISTINPINTVQSPSNRKTIWERVMENQQKKSQINLTNLWPHNDNHVPNNNHNNNNNQ